jgi:ABC-type transport system involved in cytochrome bd biosynthesis fused ATPase/permease subunit
MSIFSGVLLFGLVELAFPTPMSFPPVHSPSLMHLQHGQGNFSASFNQQLLGQDDQGLTKNSDENAQKRREQEQKQFKKIETERMRVSEIKSIIRFVIIIFIASTVFAFHWRMAKQARMDSHI